MEPVGLGKLFALVTNNGQLNNVNDQILDLHSAKNFLRRRDQGLDGRYAARKLALGSHRSAVDKGKGGKYLILPPGHKDKVPEGYVSLPSQTYQGYALLRSILKSGSEADFNKAVEYGKRIRFYPLSRVANPAFRRRRRRLRCDDPL